MRAYVILLAVVGCSKPPTADADAALGDAAIDAPAPSDASLACASSAGESGECMDVTACSAIADHISQAGHCPGPAAFQCCLETPSVADNPPFPPGYKLLTQAEVTPAMTTWAVDILHDPITYPMFATAMMTFGSLDVLARVEWHPPDFQNNVIHRGVTLYEPG